MIHREANFAATAATTVAAAATTICRISCSSICRRGKKKISDRSNLNLNCKMFTSNLKPGDQSPIFSCLCCNLTNSRSTTYEEKKEEFFGINFVGQWEGSRRRKKTIHSSFSLVETFLFKNWAWKRDWQCLNLPRTIEGTSVGWRRSQKLRTDNHKNIGKEWADK